MQASEPAEQEKVEDKSNTTSNKTRKTSSRKD